jgi:tetratricopeptide (TPR) repeat protein
VLGISGALIADARVALAEHRFADSAKLAQEFVDTRPSDPVGWETLFDAKLELGAYAGAAKALEKLKAQGGDAVSVGSREAQWARIHGGDAAAPLDAAIASLREASRPQPATLAWCLVQRGEVAFVMGDFATADRCYAEALTASPDDWRAQSHVAELRAADGKYDEALALLSKCIEATGRPELLQAAGDMEMARQRPEAAKAWHDRALAAYRASVDRGEKLYVHHLAGFYCDVRPQASDAVRLAKVDLVERQSIYAHAALAWALHLDGKMEEAASEAAAALATHTRDAHVLYQAGMIFTAADDLARGRAALRAAEEANPKQMCFHFHR